MTLAQIGLLLLTGLGSGLFAGILGIGGGTILVPAMVSLQYTPVQAVATSSLAIVITSLSGSIQNWRMGYLDWRQVLSLGFPSLITAQVGVELATSFSAEALLNAFAVMLLANIVLVNIRQKIVPREGPPATSPWLARLLTGGIAGLLAGLFGIGGGVVMVPLQMLLLGEPIKRAIQTSLGVIVLTALAAALGHAGKGNLLPLVGGILGTGGLLGAQISTRFLPKLPVRIVNWTFNLFLLGLAVYTFWQAWYR